MRDRNNSQSKLRSFVDIVLQRATQDPAIAWHSQHVSRCHAMGCQQTWRRLTDLGVSELPLTHALFLDGAQHAWSSDRLEVEPLGCTG